LRKRYSTYARLPKLRQRVETNADDHSGSTEPISFILASKRKPKPTIFATPKWIQERNSLSGEQEYIQQIQSDVEVVDTIDEIDVNPYALTTYQVNDYVLRRYPPSKMSGGNPHKHGSWWRGPYQVTQHCDAELHVILYAT